MSRDVNDEFNLTVAGVVQYCISDDERLGLGLSEDEIVEHNSTHSHPEPNRDTVRRAIDELERVGLLEIAVYEGSRIIYRGRKWPDRFAIRDEYEWPKSMRSS